MWNSLNLQSYIFIYNKESWLLPQEDSLSRGCITGNSINVPTQVAAASAELQAALNILNLSVKRESKAPMTPYALSFLLIMIDRLNVLLSRTGWFWSLFIHIIPDTREVFSLCLAGLFSIFLAQQFTRMTVISDIPICCLTLYQIIAG